MATWKNEPPLYSIWKGMKSRCQNPNKKQYHDYGGRGITVCPEWKNSFKQFILDMGPRPFGYLLERRDNDKGYNKDNCKWATRQEQQRNRRCTIFVEIEGVKFKAIELAEINGVKFDTILYRIKKGWAFEEVIQKERLPEIPGVGRKLAGIKSGETRRNNPTCKRGHHFDEKNTHIARNGQRVCRACRRFR
jgi:hypothetical protein